MRRVVVVFEPPDIDLCSTPVRLFAYIGDGVMELFFRLEFSNLVNVSVVEKEVRKFVSRTGQAMILDSISELLTDEEMSIVRRAMNGKFATRHGNDPLYRKGTGLEALIGYLYLKGEFDRVEFLLREGMRRCVT